MTDIYTIGHSTQTYDHFLSRLRRHSITAIADVRSTPFSRNFPQFSREALKSSLQADGVAYSFLGKELGGRPRDLSLYQYGVADYEAMARTRSFEDGLARLKRGYEEYAVALLCSEHDPLDCHRCLLVGRALSEQGHHVMNILLDGTLIDQRSLENRLLALVGKTSDDLFKSPEDQLAEAYRARAHKVAFRLAAPNQTAMDETL